jgi:hypothetical protein
MMLYRVQMLRNVELYAEMSTDAKSTGQFEHASRASPEGLSQINKTTEDSLVLRLMYCHTTILKLS